MHALLTYTADAPRAAVRALVPPLVYIIILAKAVCVAVYVQRGVLRKRSRCMRGVVMVDSDSMVIVGGNLNDGVSLTVLKLYVCHPQCDGKCVCAMSMCESESHGV